MKKLLLATFLFAIALPNYAQVSVSSKHKGGVSKIKKDDMAAFKGSTTVFVLSDVLDTEAYNTILANSWTVTPYKVVPRAEFSMMDHLDPNYSFAMLEGYTSTYTSTSSGATTNAYVHAYINVFMNDVEKIRKKLAKIDPSKTDKINDLFSDNKIDIARIELFPMDEFAMIALSNPAERVVGLMYGKDVFNNYGAGYLKNYFQIVSKTLSDNETLWMYKDEAQPELKRLITETLYVPDYVKIKFNPWKGLDKEHEDPDDLFSKYKYKYEFIDKEALSQKIMDGEPIIYLRYARINAQKFLQVVDAKTGEMYFQEYTSGMGMSYNLKSKNLGELSRKIKKAGK